MPRATGSVTAAIVAGGFHRHAARLEEGGIRFPTGSDYRIPYALSRDYWLYQRRRIEQDAAHGKIVILGDSVVWGEYVRVDGTLSHFLNQEAGQGDRFINGGVNGLFPLAMEGLARNYTGTLHSGGKVIVHCNMLWMSSPQADLSHARRSSSSITSSW